MAKEDKRLAPKVADDAEETPPDFDPMLAMYDRLPNFVKGADGENHNSHVKPVSSDDEAEEEFNEEDFGYEPRDPGSFDADS